MKQGAFQQRASVMIAAAALSALTSGGTFAGEILFSDQTDLAGLTHMHSIAGQAYPSAVSRFFGAGGAVGDFNRDGWQDLIVLGGGGAPDKLFINNGDGTFTDQAPAWNIDRSHMGMGVAVGDFNGDGWDDLFITSYGPAGTHAAPGNHLLYRNNGDGTFTDVAMAMGVRFSSPTQPDGMSAAWGDYDLDGDLDLFICGWFIGSNGNRLYRNDGAAEFTDVTSIIDGALESVMGFTPRFLDLTGDRYPELLIAGDFTTSRYLVNQGGISFVNRTEEAGAGIDANGMGQAVGDFDNDRRLDWYVTSVHTEIPNSPNVPGTGNMFYMNEGVDHFVESGAANGTNDGGWGWGVVDVDVDLDGNLDLVENNGWVGVDAQFGLQWIADPPYLFLNQGDAQFLRLPDDTFPIISQGRGMIRFDADNDGDQDLVFFENIGPLRFFRNETITPGAAGSAWLRVFLDTGAQPALAPGGVGATVTAVVGSTLLVRPIDSMTTYLSQSERSAHFGLGNATTVDLIRVNWPDGSVTELSDVPVNQTIVIEPTIGSAAGDLNGDGVVNGADLAVLLSNWGDGDSLADLDGDGVVNGADLAILLANWG